MSRLRGWLRSWLRSWTSTVVVVGLCVVVVALTIGPVTALLTLLELVAVVIVVELAATRVAWQIERAIARTVQAWDEGEDPAAGWGVPQGDRHG